MTQPIAQALSARLRDMILAGEFRGGQHLREVQLAQMFGASRTPVRLALAANEKDGLLAYSPNRGYVVRPFDPGDIAGAFEMRALIEGLAARKAAERGLSDEALRRIAEAIDTVARVLATDEALDDGAREAWRTHNAVFHRTIIESADNRFIAPTLQTVQRIPSVYPPVLASYDPALLRKYNDHHRGIRDCIVARQGVRAEFLMREHVTVAGEDIRASLHPAPELAGAAE
ncbi:GntR family transcriptional regulator [Methylobacterium sp. NEAU 140]|uniref:GntR family transcriptional regulator n=1 Tax=Methylobacterium sp. NEAU 140 TaxID=3064945 RepID=UPI002733DB19|nr:GntR family transcriptional regulator [Methylobacterium sp. NEAU 140]MDP4023971.1 GntR family transcriptional regulator [Methylobacterium sp. NEAU 140]